MNKVDVVRGLGGAGDVALFFLFASPIITMLKIWGTNSLGAFRPYPYLAGMMNCSIWICYAAVSKDTTAILIINVIGLVLEAFYVLMFYLFSPNDLRRRLVFMLLGVVVVVLTVCIPGSLMNGHAKIYFMSFFSYLALVTLNASSISWEFLRHQNTDALPCWECVAGLLNGIIWFIHSLLRKHQPIYLYRTMASFIAAFISCMLLMWYLLSLLAAPAPAIAPVPAPAPAPAPALELELAAAAAQAPAP